MDNKDWIPIKQICRENDISPNGKVAEIRKDKRFETKKIRSKSADGKYYNMYCIPIRQKNLFLSIYSKKGGTTKNGILYITPEGEPIYTYILWDNRSEFVKIGKSTNPRRRLSNHRSSHKDLQMIYCIRGDLEPYFRKEYGKFQVEDKTEHYWLCPPLVDGWLKFEDVDEYSI